MSIPVNLGDLSRTTSMEPDQTWPSSIKVKLEWLVDGLVHVRTLTIDPDAFFGLGRYGAPMDGAALIGAIENMRKQGPPPVPKRAMVSPNKRKPIYGTKKKR